jgi:hypothetical protein
VQRRHVRVLRAVVEPFVYRIVVLILDLSHLSR